MHRLIEDANAIIPESEIFKVQGSYAPFADWFRHKLVSVTGGFWVDTDVVCLRKFEFDEAMVFGLMETDYANIAVMRFPIGHIVTTTLAEACNNPNCILPYDDFRTRKRKLIRKYLLGNRRNNTKYGEPGGPDGFSAILKHFELLARAKPFFYFYPIHYTCWKSFFDRTFEKTAQLFEASYAIHMWTEHLARNGVDKDATFESGSLYEQLKRRYL